MVRISIELINNSYQFINAVNQREITLRNLQIPTIENLGITKDQFDVIDLTDNNIRKLDNLPVLKRLETLYLHGNRIQQIDKNIGEKLPKLKTLALTNNNIVEFGDIDPLSKCKKLEYLTLIGNPLTHKQHYRLYVIFKLRSVRVLDFRRVKLAERKAAKKLFKGSSGEVLRLEIVKESAPLLDDINQSANQINSRSLAEQEKLKELIKSAKTLSEVENLHKSLQFGKIPTSLDFDNNNHNVKNGFEEEEEEEEEDEEMNMNNEEINNKEINVEEINNEEMNVEEINNKEINSEEINNEEMNVEEINNKEINSEEINNEEMNVEEINNKEINSEEINNKEINSEEMNVEETNNKEIINEEINDEEINNEEINNEEMNNKEINTEEMNVEETNNEEMVIEEINKNQENEVMTE